MPELDPQHELPAGHEPLDLPPPHLRSGWSWLLSLAIASSSTFILILTLLSIGMSVGAVSIIGVVTFVLATFLVHAIAERAR